MAQFCTKCGTPLTEGLKFCTSCGATMGEPAAPVAQAPPPAAPRPAAVAPVAQVPVGPVAAAPTASSGSSVMKIVLIVVAVLIFFGLLSAGACVYMVYRAKQKVNQFEKQVHTTFPVPAGTPGQQTGPAIDLGVPVYPGATPTGAGTSVSMGSGAIKVQEYTTSDSPDQVAAFYKAKLGPNAILTQNGQQALVQLSGSNGYANIAIAPDGNTGKTKFTISSVGK